MNRIIKAPFKKIFMMITSKDYRYHRDHRHAAQKIVSDIEKVKGRIKQRLIKLSNEYARDVLGWIGYSPWLHAYCAVAGTFKEGWIPDNYYGKVVIPEIKGDYGHFISRKPLTNLIFRSETFPDVASYMNGLFFSNNNEVVNDNDIRDFLFRRSEVVVFKSDNSYRGEGILFFKRNSFDLNKLRVLGNGVFQEYIHQHDFFDEIMPSSVATLRLTTVLDNNGNFSLRASYLRIGRKEDTHVKSKSALRIPVNPNSGELAAEGYLPSWITVYRHPDTQFVFSGQKIPFFDRCASTVLGLHMLMPFVRCIGWDVCVDKDNNVKVMECNGGHNGIKFTEAVQGPCFADLGWEKLWREK